MNNCCPQSGELAKGPSSLPPRPLFSQCEAHGPPIGVGREKNVYVMLAILTILAMLTLFLEKKQLMTLLLFLEKKTIVTLLFFLSAYLLAQKIISCNVDDIDDVDNAEEKNVYVMLAILTILANLLALKIYQP